MYYLIPKGTQIHRLGAGDCGPDGFTTTRAVIYDKRDVISEDDTHLFFKLPDRAQPFNRIR